MKRTAFFLILAFSLLLCACRAPRGDFFEIFESGFEAQLEGTLNGLDFTATLQMEKSEAEGVPPATVTFYAPRELAGTVLARAADGTVTLSAGELSVSLESEIGAALFSAFPTNAAIKEISVTDEGHTVVTFEGGELTFLSDGTPYKIKTAGVSATVVKFKNT